VTEGQLAQPDFPAAAWKVPAAQRVHDVAAAGE